jgi:hypothetical protein
MEERGKERQKLDSRFILACDVDAPESRGLLAINLERPVLAHAQNRHSGMTRKKLNLFFFSLMKRSKNHPTAQNFG